MPLDLTAKQNQTRSATAYFDGETVTLEYRYMGLSADYFNRLDALPDRLGANTQLLADAVTKWDIVAGGAPYPITPESIRALPGTLVGALAEAIIDDLGKLTARPPKV